METIKAINCLNRIQRQAADIVSSRDTPDEQSYLAAEDVEALTIAIDAVSRVEEIDTPKMVNKNKYGDFCPSCGKYLMYKDVHKCYWCGQSLMWDDRKTVTQEVIVYEGTGKDSDGMPLSECRCPRCGYGWMNSYPPKADRPCCPSCGQIFSWPDWAKNELKD